MSEEKKRAYYRKNVALCWREITLPELLGGDSELVPPDSISNSEVKRFSADDSVGFPHVKVGHCQVCNDEGASLVMTSEAFFFACNNVTVHPATESPVAKTPRGPVLRGYCLAITFTR
jgi:hypothetical protein